LATKDQQITNGFCFKTRLNVVIAEYDPERRFVRKLFELQNAENVDG
jgi:hypothetical protein